ncbi:DUF4397 domain-containing protein [Sphingobacterium hungaricum]|nr:DUF4397 domain-containing protein [Sphingobacterium hungaricum]
MKITTLKPLLFLTLGITLFTSCLKDDGEYITPPVAAFTMINGYVEEPGVIYRVHQNGYNDPLFRLNYKSYLKNTLLYAGSRQLSIYSGVNNAKIVDTVYTFKDSTSYSGFVYGLPGDAKFIVSEDKSIADLGDNAGLRFFHLADGVDDVNITIGNETSPVFTRTEQQDSTNIATNQVFVAKASGSTTIVAKNAAGTEIARRENYDLKPGRYYSIILIGDATSTELPLYIGLIEY